MPTDTVAATAKWGDIGDWDVSGVKDFSYAFSRCRNVGGSYVGNAFACVSGNPKVAEMNSDLSKWNVAKVRTLPYAFYSAYKFAGVGLDSWDISKVTDMSNTFTSATSLTTCNKRKIADAWKSSAVFVATSYDTDWAADKCTVCLRMIEGC